MSDHPHQQTQRAQEVAALLRAKASPRQIVRQLTGRDYDQGLLSVQIPAPTLRGVVEREYLTGGGLLLQNAPIVRGVTSSNGQDLHRSRMRMTALEDMRSTILEDMTFFLNHSYTVPEDVLGRGVEAALVQRRYPKLGRTLTDLDIGVLVDQTNPRALQFHQQAVNKIKLGFSIGAFILEYGWEEEGTEQEVWLTEEEEACVEFYGPPPDVVMGIDHVLLVESSGVGIPSNRQSWTRQMEVGAQLHTALQERYMARPGVKAPPPKPDWLGGRSYSFGGKTYSLDAGTTYVASVGTGQVQDAPPSLSGTNNAAQDDQDQEGDTGHERLPAASRSSHQPRTSAGRGPAPDQQAGRDHGSAGEHDTRAGEGSSTAGRRSAGASRSTTTAALVGEADVLSPDAADARDHASAVSVGAGTGGGGFTGGYADRASAGGGGGSLDHLSLAALEEQFNDALAQGTVGGGDPLSAPSDGPFAGIDINRLVRETNDGSFTITVADHPMEYRTGGNDAAAGGVRPPETEDDPDPAEQADLDDPAVWGPFDDREESISMRRATDAEKRAQEKRATRYGIGIKKGGNVTKPSNWSAVPEREWGDPVNYRYPMPDAEHADNAASRWDDGGDRDGYGSTEQDIIAQRIAARQESFAESANENADADADDQTLAAPASRAAPGRGGAPPGADYGRLVAWATQQVETCRGQKLSGQQVDDLIALYALLSRFLAVRGLLPGADAAAVAADVDGDSADAAAQDAAPADGPAARHLPVRASTARTLRMDDIPAELEEGERREIAAALAIKDQLIDELAALAEEKRGLLRDLRSYHRQVAEAEAVGLGRPTQGYGVEAGGQSSGLGTRTLTPEELMTLDPLEAIASMRAGSGA